MTSKPRASLGFDDDAPVPAHAEALKSFDPKAFQAPPPRPSNDRPDKETARKAAEAIGFPSREGGKPVAVPAPARRRRNFTGRSEQINVRATSEYKARFQAVVAKQGWSDAVTMEKAIELLEKHYSI